jgi:dipeptidyl aminopeptidase/acylaminoacyl peptidase
MTEAQQQPITVERMLDLATLSDIQLSPDGTIAAFVRGRAYTEAGTSAPTSIVVVTIDDGLMRPYSPPDAHERMPRWSPDGKTLAILSDRPDREGMGEASGVSTRVYLLSRDGSSARPLSAAKGEVQDMVWAPDGSRLILLMTEPHPENLGSAPDVVEVEKHPRYARLWSLDIGGDEVAPLTPAGLQVWEFGLSHDGRDAAVVVSDAPYEWSWYQSRLAMASLDTGRVTTIYTSPRQLAHPRVSPDGTAVSIVACTWSDRGVIGGDVLVVPVQGGEAHNLTAGRPVSISCAEWESGGVTLLCCGYTDGEIAFWRLDRAGDHSLLWQGESTFVEQFQPRFSRSGDVIAVLREDISHPIDLWLARLSAHTVEEWRQLTQLHGAIDEWDLGPVRTVRWTAADHTPIQGLLALPPGERDRTTLPLVTLVHGGPAFLQPHAFFLDIVRWARMLAARGIAVLLPNPRGSTGWGTSFTEANLGDMGGADFTDIMSGVDHVIGLGVADPDRLGIGGFSYGGFMAAWAVTQTARFKAAVMFAGISDWQSFHGVGPVSTWDAIALGSLGHPANPYDPSGPHVRFSPLTHVERATTPTLIINGEGDMFAGQGYQFFRALKDRGVEVEMVIYSGEGHNVIDRAHQIDMGSRVTEWFATHLR